jgi:AcrR family transcriptional regulator
MTSAIRHRRRGAGLEHAIYEAVLAELTAVGYRGLTMEGVAARAGTGKASLYRRWANKQELVLRAMSEISPELIGPAVDTGQLRGDLVGTLSQMTESIEATDRALYPVVLEMILERRQHPDLATTVIDQLLEPRLQAIMDALRRAARRGEVRTASVSELLVRVGPAMVIHQLLQYGTVPSPDEIEDIVDLVMLPALQHGRVA